MAQKSLPRALRSASLGTQLVDGWVSVDLGDPDIPWEIGAKITIVDGVAQLTSLRLEPKPSMWSRIEDDGTEVPVAGVDPKDAVITTERLRRLPLVHIARVAAKMTAGDVGGAARELSGFTATWPQGRKRPDEHYEEVAEVYLDAARRHEPPTKAIQERWNVGRAMASRYVKQARERGLLGQPSRPGVGGSVEQTPKVKRGGRK